jgi:2'-5' RNA ligase
MENMYFMAITPPEAISQKIITIQEDFASRFESHASLKIMPHITIKGPFRFPDQEHETVVSWFSQLNIPVAPFTLELKNFDAFHRKDKPVIFIKPSPNPSLLSLQKHIIARYNEKFPGEPVMNLELNYHPHLTVAYRDLKPASFREAWEEFKEKEFSGSFEVNDYHLLQHNGKKWEVIKSGMLQF